MSKNRRANVLILVEIVFMFDSLKICFPVDVKIT